MRHREFEPGVRARRTLGLILSAAALWACDLPESDVPHGSSYGGASKRVESVRTGDGGEALVIECAGYVECMRRAWNACPGGYEILGDHSHRSVTPAQQAAYSFRVMGEAMRQCSGGASSSTPIGYTQPGTDVTQVNIDVCIESALPEPPEGILVDSLLLRCRAPAEETAKDAATARPEWLLGFPLDGSATAIADQCAAQGHQLEISERQTSCDGAGAPMDVDSRVGFEFCSDVVCRAAGEVSLPVKAGHVLKEYRRVEADLVAQFGTPFEREMLADKYCMTTSRFEECVRDRRVRAKTTWKWADETQYSAQLLPPLDGSAEYRIRLAYRRGVTNVASAITASPRTSTVTPPASQTPSVDRTARACIPGQSFSCVGPRGCQGYQVCAANGASLESCVCD